MGLLASALCVLVASSMTILEVQSEESDTLRFVHVVWRHGDRSPSKGTFPTDTKNNESTWPQGWGELSDEGIQQHYHLGQYLRQRYVDSGFLSSDYKANEIFIRSTSYNRTIMSALANLAGMYPPPEARRWSQNITWQPIPVHSTPKEMDPMLWMDLSCPVAEHIYHEEIMKSEEVRRIEAAYSDFMKFLVNATGLKKVTLDDIWTVFDPLNCERAHSREIPSWVTESIFAKIKELNDIGGSFYYHDFRLQRLRGGLLFGEIASRMEAKARKEPSLHPKTLKYYVYSAHDTTLMALLENLGVFDKHTPEYATAVMIELHETKSKGHVVKVFHINETGSHSPVPLAMKGCGATESVPQCDLDAFVTMARAHTPNDWNAECGIVNQEFKKTKAMTIAAIVLGVTTGILLLVVIFLVWKLKHESILRWAPLGSVSS